MLKNTESNVLVLNQRGIHTLASTLYPCYNALQYNADSVIVITRLRSWTPIFQVGLVSG